MAEDTILGDVTMDTTDESFYECTTSSNHPGSTRKLSLYDKSPVKSLASTNKKLIFSNKKFSTQKSSPSSVINRSRMTNQNSTFQNNSFDFSKFVDCADVYSESPLPASRTINTTVNESIAKSRHISRLIQNETLNASSNSLASFERNEQAVMQNENSFLEERFPSFISSGTPVVNRSRRISLNRSAARNRSQKKSPRTKKILKDFQAIEDSILNDSEIESRLLDDQSGLKKDTYADDGDELPSIFVNKSLNESSLKVSNVPIKDIVNMDDSTFDDPVLEHQSVTEMMLKVAENDPDLSFNDSTSFILSPISKGQRVSKRTSITQETVVTVEQKNITKSIKKNVSFQFESRAPSKSITNDTADIIDFRPDFKSSTPLLANETRIKRLFADKQMKTDNIIFEDELGDDNESNNCDINDEKRSISKRLFDNVSLKVDEIVPENYDVEMISVDKIEVREERPKSSNETVRVPRRLFAECSKTPKADYEQNVDFGLKKMLKTPNAGRRNETIHVTRKMFEEPSKTPKADYERNVDFGLKNMLKSPTKARNADETVHVTRKMFEEPQKSPKADYEKNVDFGMKNMLKSPPKSDETVHVTRKMFEEPQQEPEADYEKNVDFGLKNMLKTPNVARRNETIHVTRKMFEEPQKSPEADYEKNVDFGLKNMMKSPTKSNETIHVTRKMFEEPQKSPEADYEKNVDFGLKVMMKSPTKSGNGNETIHVTRKMFEEPQKSPKADYEKNVDFGLKNMLKSPKFVSPERITIKKLFQATTPEANYSQFVDCGLKRMMERSRRSPSPAVDVGSDDDEESVEQLVSRPSKRLSLRSSRHSDVNSSGPKSEAEDSEPNVEDDLMDSPTQVEAEKIVPKTPEVEVAKDSVQPPIMIAEEDAAEKEAVVEKAQVLTPVESGDENDVQPFYLSTRSGQKPIPSKSFKVNDSVAARLRDFNQKLNSKRQTCFLSLSSMNSSAAKKYHSPRKASSSSSILKTEQSSYHTPENNNTKKIKTEVTTLKKKQFQDAQKDMVSEADAETEVEEPQPVKVPAKKTRGRSKRAVKAETDTEADEDAPSSPKTAKTTSRGRKKATTEKDSTAPVRATRGRKKKDHEDDLAELAGFHQEVEDARLDQLIIDAADDELKPTTRRGKATKTTTLATRNRKRKAEAEQEAKLNTVIGQTGDCDVQVLEEFIEDETVKKATTKMKAKATTSTKKATTTKETESKVEAAEVVEKPKRGRKPRQTKTLEEPETETTETPPKPKTKRTTAKSKKAEPENIEVISPEPVKKTTRGGRTAKKTVKEAKEPEPEDDEPPAAKPKAKRAPRGKSKATTAAPKDDDLIAETSHETTAGTDESSHEVVKPRRVARKRTVTAETDASTDEPEVKTTRRNLRSRK